MALGKAGYCDHAGTLLGRALAAAPADFSRLANLGVAASLAGHHERARDVLQAALRQRPENVDILYNLAYGYSALTEAPLGALYAPGTTSRSAS